MLSQFCIRRPIFATVLSLIIIIAGLVAFNVLPVAQYPNITPPVVTISTTWEGANARTLARTVAAPIEEQLAGIDGLIYYTTSIRVNGEIRITCVFDVGTDPDDATVEINNRVRTAERRLPDKVRAYGITVRKRSTDFLMTLVYTSPDGSMSIGDMADYALLNVVDFLKRIPEIGDVTIYGNVESAMRIWLDPLRMAKMKVTPSDVESAIDDKNAERGAGRIGTYPTPDDQQLFYTTEGQRQLLTAEEFGDVIVRTEADGTLVRIRDFARTELGRRSYEFMNVFNGRPAVSIGIFLQTGANAMAAGRQVETLMAELEKDYPKGAIEHHVTGDSTVFVRESLKEVYKTLGEAGLLVLLVVFIFLQNWRATLIPMLAVPVSLVGTMACLWLFNFSLNTLTLFAMTLSIGIVVDDAIVVLENVERLMRDEGLSPFRAAQKAMTEVSSALVAIVLVLSAVFVPVAFLGGMAGELYRQFALTLAASVCLSGFVALTLTPALCAVFLRPKSGKTNIFSAGFNRVLEFLTSAYLWCVRLALKLRPLCAVILMAVCAGCWWLWTNTPTSFIPTEDQGFIRMSVSLPDGASFIRTYRETETIRKQIEEEIGGISSVLVQTGMDSQGNDIRPNAATFIVKLDHWNDREVTAFEIRDKMQEIANRSRDSVSTATLPAAIPGLGSANGFAGHIQARGNDDPLVLQNLTKEFISALEETGNVRGLRTFIRAEAPILKVSLDTDKAMRLGVLSENVYDTLLGLFAGSYINDFTRNGRLYRVIMQADDEFRMNPEDLTRFYTRSTGGDMVALGSLLDVERISGAESITRMNGYLSSQFSGAGVLGVSSGDAIRTVEMVGEEILPEGYHIEWVDQAWHEKRIGTAASTSFIFGLIIVFLILAALYERWSLPVAIVLALPYGLLGALTAIWLRNFSNDIYFQIGLLVLIGLSCKNAILIVEFAAQKMEEGMGVFDAAVAAAKIRLRPILMTSLAFVLGIVPLVFATGAGAQSRQSMGTGVFGGMIFSTFIATVFVPVFFTWFISTKKSIEQRELEREAAREKASAGEQRS